MYLERFISRFALSKRFQYSGRQIDAILFTAGFINAIVQIKPDALRQIANGIDAPGHYRIVPIFV